MIDNKKIVLQLKNLSVGFHNKTTVHNVSFSLEENSILGIVGESGSGKSVTSMAILGLLPQKIATISGSILFQGQEISNLQEKEYQKLRSKEIGVIFQEPMSALNPSMKCGAQVSEVLRVHQSISKSEAQLKVLDLFEKVKLPNIKRIYNAYPHELSGGQKQRIVIAMAIACNPKLLIADEPTTALDVTVQKDIIDLLKDLQKQFKMSIIFISHDLNLVSQIADRTLVMLKGKVLENQPTQTLFTTPKNIYTKALIASRPDDSLRLKRLPTVDDFLNETLPSDQITTSQRQSLHKKLYDKKPILRVENVSKSFFISTSWFSKKEFKAVTNVSFSVYEGETLGLVGESGCGKSTLGNLILKLTSIDKGKIYYKDNDISNLHGEDLKDFRKEIQLIFQDPFASLNPKISIGNAIMETMVAHNIYTNTSERKLKVLELLKRVGLEECFFDRYPHEFSGGQRQRVGIARTIALNPKLIICDESVSALDISVQAQVLNLLNELKEDFNFTYIFISHDLSVVKYMSDNLLVMKEGSIEERGEADEIYNKPQKQYTQELIKSIPKPRC